MSDIKERLRTFEGSDALGDGDFSLLHETADHITALESKLVAAEAENARLKDRICIAGQLAKKSDQELFAAEAERDRLLDPEA